MDQLCDEVEARGQLKLLTPFLEQLIGEGSQDPNVHSALGKILIETNNNPKHFLSSNPHYDHLSVGRCGGAGTGSSAHACLLGH